MKACAIMTGLLFLGAGCASPPEIEHPPLDMEVPDRWTGADPEPGKLKENWWTDFHEPGLDRMVELALDRNYDLQAAAARISQAAAEAKIVGADLQPQADLGLSRLRQRRNYIGFPIGGGGGGVESDTFTTWGLSMNISWELDVWGRLRAGHRAALADYQAAEIDYRGARLSLAGQTAKTWLAIAEAVQQVALAEITVKSWRDSAEQVRSRYERGVRSSLDVRLSLSNLADAEAFLAERRLILDSTIRQLEVLLGRYPGRTIDIPEALPSLVAHVPAGLPSELVSRRPDLAVAERRLAAAGQRLEAAEWSLYPRFSLTASGGTSSEHFDDLFDNDYRVWSLLGNLTQPIFQGGRLRAGVDRAAAIREEALAAYAGSVLKAYAEVESALVAEELLADRESRLVQATEQARAAEQLALNRYRSGLEDYITVLESQRRAATNESNLLGVRRAHLENRVDLYLALGGGFEMTKDEDRALAKSDEATTAEGQPQ